MTDRYTDSVDRQTEPNRPTGPTDGRTRRTNGDRPSPTSETSPFVTRTRTYADFLDLRRAPTADELAELRRLAREGAERVHQQAATDDTRKDRS